MEGLIIKKIQKSVERQRIEEKKKEMSSRKLKVLLIDDSLAILNLLEKAINADPDLEVVGKAKNAFEARQLLLEHDPDVLNTRYYHAKN